MKDQTCLSGDESAVERLTPVVFVTLRRVYALSLIASNAIAKYPDTGAFPEAPRIADSLEALMKEGDKVYASVPADYPTYYYLWYHRLRDFRVKESIKKESFRFSGAMIQTIRKRGKFRARKDPRHGVLSRM
jgi:hypothetical protein